MLDQPAELRSGSSQWAIWALETSQKWAGSEGFQEALERYQAVELLPKVLDQPWGEGSGEFDTCQWPLDSQTMLHARWLHHLPSSDGPCLLLQICDATGASEPHPSTEMVQQQTLGHIIPKLLHQLKNHLTVIQNSSAALEIAMRNEDEERIEKCQNLALKGVTRADALLTTITVLADWDIEAILEHYRRRYSAVSIEIEVEGEVPAGDLWVAAIVVSLEYSRPNLPQETTLRIHCEETALHFTVDGLDQIADPPLQSGFFGALLECRAEGVGWVVTNPGGNQ